MMNEDDQPRGLDRLYGRAHRRRTPSHIEFDDRACPRRAASVAGVATTDGAGPRSWSASASLLRRVGAEFAHELCRQMGRPIRYAPSEIRGTLERARYMISIAASALADVDPAQKQASAASSAANPSASCSRSLPGIIPT